MESVSLLFILIFISVTTDIIIHGSTIQCGECHCVEVRQNFILDCENLGMTAIPDVDHLIRRHVTRAYMAGNRLQTFAYDAFDKWYSLEFIDLTNNPELECAELTKIPPDVEIQVSCIQRKQGK